MALAEDAFMVCHLLLTGARAHIGGAQDVSSNARRTGRGSERRAERSSSQAMMGHDYVLAELHVAEIKFELKFPGFAHSTAGVPNSPPGSGSPSQIPRGEQPARLRLAGSSFGSERMDKRTLP